MRSVIHVIDVPGTYDNQILRILLNAEKKRAIGYLTLPEKREISSEINPSVIHNESEEHWVWRHRMAEAIAAHLDSEKFGVHKLYLFGSTKTATAGPSSDINLLVHFRGTEQQKKGLDLWMDGWSISLAEVNFLRTGHRSAHLLDVHYITDDDIENGTGYMEKIPSISNMARELKLNRK
jgi:predicted nucleotidyltransferase